MLGGLLVIFFIGPYINKCLPIEDGAEAWGILFTFPGAHCWEQELGLILRHPRLETVP